MSGDDGDPGAPEPWSTVVATGAAYRRPSPGLSERVAATLDEGLPVAKERLRSRASCRALFTRLGSDGAAKVDEASYHPATAEQERLVFFVVVCFISARPLRCSTWR